MLDVCLVFLVTSRLKIIMAGQVTFPKRTPPPEINPVKGLLTNWFSLIRPYVKNLVFEGGGHVFFSGGRLISCDSFKTTRPVACCKDCGTSVVSSTDRVDPGDLL